MVQIKGLVFSSTDQNEIIGKKIWKEGKIKKKIFNFIMV